jgi:large subunit ribosomal protein L31
MKSDIHPNYSTCEVTCSCGASFTTRSTVEKLHIDICSECHPFYTGQMKYVDSAGRVEKFQKKYNWGARKKD